MLVGILTRADLAARSEPPDWYRFPEPDLLPRYAVALSELQHQILADKKNAIIPPLDSMTHGDSLERALYLALDGREHPQCAVMALTAALYAHRAGALDGHRRERVLELLVKPSPPLDRLAPHLVAALDAEQIAPGRFAALRQGAPAPYAAWLDETAQTGPAP